MEAHWPCSERGTGTSSSPRPETVVQQGSRARSTRPPGSNEHGLTDTLSTRMIQLQRAHPSQGVPLNP